MKNGSGFVFKGRFNPGFPSGKGADGRDFTTHGNVLLGALLVGQQILGFANGHFRLFMFETKGQVPEQVFGGADSEDGQRLCGSRTYGWELLDRVGQSCWSWVCHAFAAYDTPRGSSYRQTRPL